VRQLESVIQKKALINPTHTTMLPKESEQKSTMYNTTNNQFLERLLGLEQLSSSLLKGE
jgi:hypothetical protein